MPRRGLRIFGWTISISLISLIIVYFFLRAIDTLMSDWLNTNSLWIAIVTGILIIALIITGSIKVMSLIRKGKRVF